MIISNPLYFLCKDTEDKINWLRTTLLQLQKRSGEQERCVREGLQDVAGKLNKLIECSEELTQRQETVDSALKELKNKK